MFSQLFGGVSCKKFSRDATIQGKFFFFFFVQETAVSWAEKKDIAEGLYWRDGILMQNGTFPIAQLKIGIANCDSKKLP